MSKPPVAPPTVPDETEVPPRAGKSQRPQAPAPVTNKPANPWQAMLDELSAGQAGPNFFLKNGRTRLRIVPEPESMDEATPTFFFPVQSSYRGRVRTKFLLRALVISADGRDLPADKVDTVLPVVVPKGVITDILNALAEGWELFDPEEGHGVSISKSGTGLSTEYAVSISPKPVALPEGYTELEMSLEECAEEFHRIAAERAAQQGEDEETADEPPAAPETRRASSRRTGGNGPSSGSW